MVEPPLDSPKLGGGRVGGSDRNDGGDETLGDFGEVTVPVPTARVFFMGFGVPTTRQVNHGYENTGWVYVFLLVLDPVFLFPICAYGGESAASIPWNTVGV